MTEKRMTEDQSTAVTQVQGDLAISAGAGSGKTTVLAHRFAQALSESADAPWAPAAIDQVLTITFTKKAAGEIGERVRRVLISEVSVAAGRRISEAWISTFHTFCGRLVRRHLLEADVEPGFVQLDEVGSSAIAEEAFEFCCTPLYEADNDVRRLVDGWGAQALRETVSAAHENARSMGLDPGEVIVPNDEEALAEVLSKTIAVAQEYHSELQEAKQTPSVSACAEGLRAWCDSVRACRVGEGLCERARELESLGDVPRMAKTEAREAYKGARERLSAAITAAGDPGLTSALEKLLRAYAEAFARIKRERNSLDFDDLQERAVGLLSGYPDVAAQYRSRFRMIMVDEFQDTNDLQMRVLEPLRNDNLCIVGDERQSIYGFRYADVKVFERVRADLGNTIELDANFRSHPRIMDVVNTSFSMPHLFGGHFMKLSAGRMDGWKLRLPEDAPRVECALVELDGLKIENAREIEAEHIALRVKEMLDGGSVAGEDIAVLLRAGSQAAVYARALERHGIPVLVSAGVNLFEAPETGEMLSLLRAIAVPTDDEALLLLLGGRFIALSDDALFALRTVTPRGQSLWMGLKAIAEDTEASIDIDEIDRAAAAHAYHVLDSFGRNQSRYGLAELLHRACEEFDYDLMLFAQGPEGVRAWANVLKLARVADQFDTSTTGDLAAFVAYLRERQESAKDKSAAAEAGPEAVRIMTVHAAKGLEFPIVFVADLARAKTRGSDSLIVGRATRDGRDVPAVGMRTPGDAWGGATTATHMLMAPTIQAAALEEEKRCLYVAATRAQELLVFSGAARLGKPAADGANLIDWIREALGDPDASGIVDIGSSAVKVTVLGADEIAAPEVLPGAPEPAPEFATPAHQERTYSSQRALPAEISYSALHLHDRCPLAYEVKYSLRLGVFADPASQSPTGLGSAVHAVLEVSGAGGPTPESIDNVVRRFGLDTAQRARLEAAVTAFMDSDVAHALYGGERVRHEEPLRVGLGATHLVGKMDAIAWRGSNALVVDYKTGKGSEDADAERYAAYELQARCYALAAFESGAETVEVVFCFVEHEAMTITLEFAREHDHETIREDVCHRIELIAAGQQNHLPEFDANVCRGCPALGGLCPIDPPPGRG